MWIFTPHGALALTENPQDEKTLIVLAAEEYTLRDVFPGVDVRQDLRAYWPYAATLNRTTVASRDGASLAVGGPGDDRPTRRQSPDRAALPG